MTFNVVENLQENVPAISGRFFVVEILFKKEACLNGIAVNFGIVLVAEVKKILLLDADAQDNLTDSLLGFYEPYSLSVSLVTMLVKGMTEELFEPKEGILLHKGIDLMPESIELSAVEVANAIPYFLRPFIHDRYG